MSVINTFVNGFFDKNGRIYENKMRDLIEKWLRKFDTYVILISEGDIAAAETLYKNMLEEFNAEYEKLLNDWVCEVLEKSAKKNF